MFPRILRYNFLRYNFLRDLSPVRSAGVPMCVRVSRQHNKLTPRAARRLARCDSALAVSVSPAVSRTSAATTAKTGGHVQAAARCSVAARLPSRLEIRRTRVTTGSPDELGARGGGG